MRQLGEILLSRGWVTQRQLNEALARHQEMGGRLGTCLLELDAVPEDLLVKVLSEQLDVPFADIEDLRNVPEQVAELLPTKMAVEHEVVPFRQHRRSIDVAMLDVHNVARQDELSFILGKTVNVHIANEARIYEALQKYYGKPSSPRFASVIDRLNKARDRWKLRARREAAASDETEAAAATPEPPAHVPAPTAAPEQPATAAGTDPPPGSRLAAASPNQRVGGPLSLSEEIEGRLAGSRGRGGAASAGKDVAAAARQTSPPAAEGGDGAAEEVGAGHAEDGSSAATAGGQRKRRSIPLSDTELELLGTAKPVAPEDLRLTAMQELFDAAPSAAVEEVEPPSGSSVDERLERCRTSEEVGQVLLDALSEQFVRTLLFQIRGGVVSGWLGRGPALDLARFRAYRVALTEPSIFFNLDKGGTFFFGRLPPMPAHLELAACWEGDVDQDCAVLPVRLRNRLVAVAYGDRDCLGLDGIDIPEVRRLPAKAAIAFEMCIMQQKLRKT